MFLSIVSLVSCTHSSKYADPQGIFDHAKSKYLSGHLISAEQDAQKAADYFSKRSLEWEWKFRLLQAEILIKRGLSKDALSLLSPFPSSFSNTDLPIKNDLLQGLAHVALGQLDDADSSFHRAEQLCSRTDTDITAEVLAGQGILEVRRNRPEHAEQLFRNALQLAKQRGLRYVEASTLLNLSYAAVNQRRYDDAIDWSNKASLLARSIDSGIVEEKALGNQGWSYYQTGDLERSLALSLEAEKRSRELGVIKDQVRWVYNVGAVYDGLNQFSVAQERYAQALDLAKQIQDPEQITNALLSLSSVSVQQQKFDLAKQYSQEAFDLAHSQNRRLGELYSLLTKGRIAVNEKQLKQAENIFHEIIKDPATESFLLWQAQNSLARLYEQQNQLKPAEEQYRNALTTLECTRGLIEVEERRLSFLTLAAQSYDDYLNFLLKQGKTDAAIQVADYSRAQTLAEGLGLLQKKKDCALWPATTINIHQVARKANTTVLFYWLGQQQSYLWAVTGNRTNLYKLPASSEIEETVHRYRKALLDPPDVLQTRNADGIKLYETLVAPAKQFIQPNSRVTIVADGSLNNLNFETLLVPDAVPHYWIQDVTVTNASSLRLLAASSMASRSRDKNLLLIGDPLVPDPKFPSLPNAKTEMQNVEQHFDPKLRDVSSGQEANPAEYFKSKPETFSYIHFVAHGTASQLSPLDSAVILSKATNEEDSYKLHARDIVGHRLRADLVVISACYGSGTTLYNGEGLVGLSWAFVRAGAHNVIGALWQVNDTSTPRLMDQMYSEIQRGKSPPEALRTAKLLLLHSDSSFRKPIYWAPFQFYTGS